MVANAGEHRRGMRKWLEFFWPFLAMLLVIVLVTYPGVVNLSSKLIGAGGDNYQYLGFQSLVAKHLQEGHYPFTYTTWWRYPQGFDFSRGYDSVLSNLVGGGLQIVTGNPVVAYNLTVWLALWFNMAMAYLLFARIGRSRWLGLGGGIAYGLSFYALARAGAHMNLVLIGGFPLAVYSIWRLWERQGWQELILVGVAVVTVFFSSLQYGIMLGIGMVVMGGLGWWFYSEEVRGLVLRLWQVRKRVGVVAGGIILVLGMVFWPYVTGLLKGGFLWHTTGNDYSPPLISYFAPNPIVPSISSNWELVRKEVEWVVFPGWLELALGGWFMVKYRSGRKKAWLGLGVMVWGLFSLGLKNPDTGLWLPYALLVQWYPFKAISETGRYMVLGQLLVVWAMILVLRDINLWGWRRKATFILIGLLLIVERWNGGRYYQIETLDGAYTEVVAAQPGKAVMDIPIFDERHNLGPALYDKPIVSGYMHWMADVIEAQGFINFNQEISRFACDLNNKGYRDFSSYMVTREERLKNWSMLARLRSEGIRTVVVHKDYKLYWEGCRNVAAQVGLLFPRVGLAQDSGVKEMWHVKWAAGVMDSGLFFPKSGKVTIEALHFRPIVPLAGLRVSLDNKTVDVTNWGYTTEDSVWTGPPVPLELYVRAGEELKIQGGIFAPEDGFLSLWYRYTSDPESVVVPYLRNGMEKIYEDEAKEVWQLQ